MVKPNSSSHWYDKDGNPAYNATLREARKQFLYPSVTSIIGILEKPMITAWKVNTMMAIAEKNRDIITESGEPWINYIQQLWEAETKKAADIGTAIHEYAERYLKAEDPEPVPGYENQCALLAEWIVNNIESAEVEKSFSCQGYGGRIDCIAKLEDGRNAVIDFKTQNCKGKKATFYPEWLWQLAAYRRAMPLREEWIGISVVIDTGDIDTIQTKRYCDQELIDAYKIFEALKVAFYAVRGMEWT